MTIMRRFIAGWLGLALVAGCTQPKPDLEPTHLASSFVPRIPDSVLPGLNAGSGMVPEPYREALKHVGPDAFLEPIISMTMGLPDM